MLDPRKIARLVSNRDRIRQGRDVTITLVYNDPAGTRYATAAVIWQEQSYAEPAARAPTDAPIDVLAEFPLGIDVRQISLIANTPTPTPAAVAAATTYEILAYHRMGIIPNRWRVHLRRLR